MKKVWEFFILILAILTSACSANTDCTDVPNAECDTAASTPTCVCETGHKQVGVSCSGNN